MEILFEKWFTRVRRRYRLFSSKSFVSRDRTMLLQMKIRMLKKKPGQLLTENFHDYFVSMDSHTYTIRKHIMTDRRKDMISGETRFFGQISLSWRIFEPI